MRGWRSMQERARAVLQGTRGHDPRWRYAAAACGAAALISALAVVWVQHEYRTTFVEAQRVAHEGDRLQEQWGMLQLEQGAWAGHSRVERLATEELDMVRPDRDEIVILRR